VPRINCQDWQAKVAGHPGSGICLHGLTPTADSVPHWWMFSHS
jgi:hypothetical protein